MKTILDSVQAAGARHLASHFHAALGDQRGIGKTEEALHAADMVGARSGLVNCPASVRTHWHESIERHFGRVQGWDVRSYNSMSGSWSKSHRSSLRDKYDVWIGDELHFCKNLESKRTQAILGADGLARRGRYKWPLSGTFAPNHRPLELFPMLKALAPEFRDITFDEYAKKFCGAFYDAARHQWNYKGAERLSELRGLVSNFLLRRTWKEAYPDRKEPQVTPMPVTLSHADLAFVNSIEDEIGGREARLSSRFEEYSQLGDTSRLLRALGTAMVPHVFRFAYDLLAVEEKVVVFAHHTDVISRLAINAQAKGLHPVIYQGGMNDRAKADAVTRFQAPECRMFIGQNQAAGTGINGLQRVCSTAILAEPSWVPGDTEQLIGRLDRVGQDDPVVNAYVMYAQATLSAVVVGVHGRKEMVGRQLNAVGVDSILDAL